MQQRVVLGLVVGAFLPGCVQLDRRPGFAEVQGVADERIGKRVVWVEDENADPALQQAIRELLDSELTSETAVQMALLNNRNLQATYEELGVAQADLVAAGLLKNPVFEIEFRWPGRPANPWELHVVEDFIDILLIPLRKRVAAAAFEQAKLRVSNAVLEMDAEVRTTFFRYQGADQMFEMRTTAAHATEATALLAQRQHEAGNISDRDFANERAVHEQARADLALAEVEVLDQRERLNTLMGVWGPDAARWRTAQRLPEVPLAETTPEALESLAVSQRLDLAAARHEIVALADSVGLARYEGLIPALSVGGHYEREPEGDATWGPSLEIPIPIFDQGQAGVGRGGEAAAEPAAILGAGSTGALGSARGTEPGIERSTIDQSLPQHTAAAAQPYRRRNAASIQRHAARSGSALAGASVGTRHGQAVHRSVEELLGGPRRTGTRDRRSPAGGKRSPGGDGRADCAATAPASRTSPRRTRMITRREMIVSSAALVAGGHSLLSSATACAQSTARSKSEDQHGHDLPYTPVLTPNGSTLPWKLVDGVKVFHLVAEPVQREFAPGLLVNCWGYNGQTPGPTIEVVEGDRVRLYVTNKLPEPTSVHWHGILLPNGMDGVSGLNQPPIRLGETFKYEFTLRQHGTHMYHAHFDEMTQMGMGLMGLFIVHPRQRPDPPIDRDFALLLSEWAIEAGTSRPNPQEMTDFNINVQQPRLSRHRAAHRPPGRARAHPHRQPQRDEPPPDSPARLPVPHHGHGWRPDSRISSVARDDRARAGRQHARHSVRS